MSSCCLLSQCVMAGWRSHTGEGCILLPQCVLTIWGGPFYKPSGSPHTWISQTELKQPHGCHLCGDTHTDTNVHTHKSASASQLHTLQMMKLIVSHCLMEHVVFLFQKPPSCLWRDIGFRWFGKHWIWWLERTEGDLKVTQLKVTRLDYVMPSFFMGIYIWSYQEP